METETKNAKIESTMLGYEDHGILTIFIHLKFETGNQGFGGYALDEYVKSREKRIPTEAVGLWVKGILDTVGVDRWEDLAGKFVRIERESKYSGKILRIGNLLEDKWFSPIT